MPLEAETGQWESLPYEVASAYVRTLMIHGHELAEADLKVKELVALDPEVKKKKTQNAQEAHAKLLQAERWIVLNPRTGQLATQAWLAKYIKADGDGKPVLKDPKSRVKPWVITLHFECLDGVTSLHLQRDPSKSKQRIRCVDLTQRQERANLAFFMQGYAQLLAEEDPDDGDDEDGFASDDSMVRDDEGLEGLG